ncbi:MAG TPA: alpha/beta hydrolase [Solirubrobacteraceae bacterium]|nr:alpha/beta hydrolase [Solirubrobacteraceae bacterium]
MATRTIDAGAGVTLGATDEGEGPAVVLLHGLTASRRYVVMGSSSLQRSGHRVAAYDARGHGESSPAPDPDAYGYEQLTADLEAVLDALRIERAVLAGVSMGAHTCLRLSLAQPERVAGLVVITPGFDPVELCDPQRLARWDALSDALRSGGIEAFAEAFGVQRLPEGWRAPVARALRQRMAAHEHLDAVADALRTVPRSAPFPDLHALEEIECPALVIGSRDEADPGHRLELAELYAELLPQGRFAVEDEGSSPLAWQGGRLSKLIAEGGARAGAA